jgi:DNA-directed RNA polymerase specialized sigma24 family protein
MPLPVPAPSPAPEELSRTIETLYRSESGRVLATLVRLLGDLDLAEESMHEAFAAALESWSQTGIPEKPRPWLISTARFKAIDAIRRRARFDGAQRDLVAHMESRVAEAPGGNAETGDEEIEDDRLRLIFTCCHPALPPEGQAALTLREVCPGDAGRKSFEQSACNSKGRFRAAFSLPNSDSAIDAALHVTKVFCARSHSPERANAWYL